MAEWATDEGARRLQHGEPARATRGVPRRPGQASRARAGCRSAGAARRSQQQDAGGDRSRARKADKRDRVGSLETESCRARAPVPSQGRTASAVVVPMGAWKTLNGVVPLGCAHRAARAVYAAHLHRDASRAATDAPRGHWRPAGKERSRKVDCFKNPAGHEGPLGGRCTARRGRLADGTNVRH
jgi:hypothetical protein